MPIRFRRTLRIFPGFKINVSKSGISESIGFKGFHLTFGKHGVRQTIGLPGSGLSETSYIVKAGDNESEDSHKAEHAHKRSGESNGAARGSWFGRFVFLLMGVAAIACIFLAAVALGLVPSNFLSHSLQSVSQWISRLGR